MAVGAVIVGWAAVSLGFVLLLWLLGAEGPPLERSAEVWHARETLATDSLPGVGVLTRFAILGFPFHWAFVALGTVAAFIVLAIAYNLHADARAPTESASAASPDGQRP